MTHLLGAQNISVEYPTQVVLDSVTLGVDAGDRIGIVGRNGQGKSTLMRVLLEGMTPDEGQVTQRSGLQVGMLTQTDSLREEDTVGLAIVGQRPEHEWAGDPRIRDVLNGLANDLDWQAPIATLSGGQRRRVALAALLAQEWDVLGLDEPTNHLDMEGVAWLATHLNNRWHPNQGGLLVITHDRWFLDAVTETTWEVDRGKVEGFEGGYAAYVLQRVERQRLEEAKEAKRQNLLRKELAWLRRGAPARTSKPKFRIQAATELIANEPPPRDTVELTKLASTRLGKEVVDLENVSVSYNTTPVLADVTWRIAPGERAGILGANGAGKSTLLKLIAGQITPDEGRVKRGKTVQLAVLDQQFSQLKNIGGDRVREVLARTKTTFPYQGREITPAQMLERLGFNRAHLSARVEDLSGGQKRRLQLLLALCDQPNVLLLDEPTNDIDTDTLTAVEDLLDTWAGTLVVVSHDRYLVERITDHQYAILRGVDGVGYLRHLPGGVEEYLHLVQTQAGEEIPEGAKPPNQPTDQTVQTPSTPRLSGAQRHALSRKLSSVERRLQRAQEEIAQLHTHMANHDPHDYEGLAELSQQETKVAGEIEQLEESWLEISEQLEG